MDIAARGHTDPRKDSDLGLQGNARGGRGGGKKGLG